MFINQIVWCKLDRGNPPLKKLLSKTEIILLYSNTERYLFSHIYDKSTIKKEGHKGLVVDWWPLPSFSTARPKNDPFFYPTQKPFKLLERIIWLSTK